MALNYSPAPWNLNGEGFIIPFFANKKNAILKGFLSEEDKKQFSGGLGFIMIVNYQTSNVGPYFELLYIPGSFHHNGKNWKRITKIYVSSEDSKRDGIINWAIPKEIAEFTWKNTGDKTEIEAKIHGKIFLSVSFIKYLFAFPLTTALLPIHLLQRNEKNYLSTKFIGKGTGKFAKLTNYNVNPNFFPELDKIAQMELPCIGASPFQLTFPVAEEILIQK